MRKAIALVMMLWVMPLVALATATGPKIQEIKRSDVNVWQFIAAIPSSMEAQITYAMMIFGALGMVAHYVLQWLKGDIEGSLFAYLFVTYPRRTGLAVAALIGATLTAITSNVFVTDAGDFVGWYNVIWVALTTGYASDSVANRGDAK